MPNESPVSADAARAAGVLLVSSDPEIGGTEGHAACSPDAVLAWAVYIGAALALYAATGPSGDDTHVALLAARDANGPRLRPVPGPVRAAFASDWQTLRTLLIDTRETLDRRGTPPDVLEGAYGAAVVTRCLWADLVRADFDAGDWVVWAGLVAAAVKGGADAWGAVVAAAEALASRTTPRRAVRARHRAVVRAAISV